ncbi:putative molybdenum cofactor biosynthesis protein 1 b protein [Phaeoacremonium minimum UCRPA7]|uniref:Putative molybdenum cofactor biosynthesis protein 1 b protein n=1 Tax=Phaeoacremonium minimum (strain UCR-PA7) TaxID=1286976 RepID=R8BTW0_PHAM7|nr:putative molybdenum cofactor biosynthesis protein 1 b protein [Phaeoacremonium minimum UCRPA7]EOO02734.1 putative molybdenum cofactor biosynthesis protein 1 b protein [Phaeoacremonium minimum UCRPA7]
MNSCLRKDEDDEPKLTHVSATGAAHMVSIHSKTPTTRTAKAVCTVVFSDSTAPRLIQENQMKKGDVLGVARIAGIMAAKRTPDLIPLCHPIALSHVVARIMEYYLFIFENIPFHHIGLDHGELSNVSL